MQHLGMEIRRLSKMMMREHVQSALHQYADRLTGMHGYLIHYLYDNREHDIFQRDIEKQFSIGRSTVTETLQLMEKNGLIVRESVPQDARLKRIVLTQKALDLHMQIEEDIAQFEMRLTDGITEEERALFLKLCEKMRQNLEKADR